MVELDIGALALQETNSVDQVRLGVVTKGRPLIGVPGVDQHIVIGALQTAHRPLPGHLRITGDIPGTAQRGADQIRGHAVIEQGLIVEWRPRVRHQAQDLRRIAT
ncbi:hypothetical protein D9M68_912240 [compost metagenome]